MKRASEVFGIYPNKRWVSGTFYILDQEAWSPISGHNYRRIVAGAGTIDPSADQTNWKILGAAGIKSIQRGVISLGVGSASATATITAVNTAKTELRNLGWRSSSSTNIDNVSVYISLTSSTVITANRGAAGDGPVAAVSWELTEYY